MDCKEVRNLLSEYLENEDFAQREFVREHLATCKNCASEFEALKATISTLTGIEKFEAPKDLLEGVRRKLRPKPQINEFWGRLFYPLHIKLPLEAAAVAVTVFLVLTFYNQSIPKPKPQQVTLKYEAAKSLEATFDKKKEEKRELASTVMPQEREATITLISQDIERDLKLLPVLVNEVGGKIIVPPREIPFEKQPPPQLITADTVALEKAQAPQLPPRTVDMTLQIPPDKMPIFMQKLEAIGPPRAEFEKAQAEERALRAKEAPSDQPILIHIKLNTPQ